MLSRRRFLSISAAVPGLALFSAGGAFSAPPEPVVWQGVAMGGLASMTLLHPDRQAALELRDRAVTEIARLEKIFSLYRQDSALLRLNRQGMLEEPPLELVELLAFALRLSRQSGGAFDPSIQPLFEVYGQHFEAHPADLAGPPSARIEAARRLVDYRAVELSGQAIRLGRSGMSLTLNGVAQGFITDRIAALLRNGGLENMLLDLGELRAAGQHPDGRPWRAGIADPAQPHRSIHSLALEGALPALATSAAHGTTFDPSGRHHHLFDPKSGRSAANRQSISVAAPTATLADGLSTAFAVLEPEQRPPLLALYPAVRVFASGADGALNELTRG